MRQVFAIDPATGAVSLVPLLVLAPLAVLFLWIWYSSRYVRFEVSPDGLKVSGDVYGRTIPVSELVSEQARVIDLGVDKDHQPSWRTNGIGLPGYKSGWFKLKNGEKALLFVTKQKNVVYVPTTSGYSVLLSVKQPEAFVAALKSSVVR